MRAAELVSAGAPLRFMADEVLKEPLVSPVQTKDFVNLQLDQKNDSGLEAAGIKTAGSARLPCIWAYNLTESKDAGTIS
jgi:hypothetical protein